MNRSITSIVVMLAIAAGACGSDDEGGFDVRVRVRGLNIAAISELEVRFEATGGARFATASGSRLQGQIHYQTNDDGRVFAAVADEEWITHHYALEESEFVFLMPFVNPSGGGDVNMGAEIRRLIVADMIKVGESTLIPVELPASAGAELDVVVGCIEGGQCGGGIVPDGGVDAGEEPGIDAGDELDAGVDAAAPEPDSGVDAGADAA